ncbi:MAG: hypothetical protein WDN49_19510 [Acetobacteraceae bacterium]
MRLSRRTVLAAGLAAPAILAGARVRAATTNVRMGSLKLIHSITPYFYERFLPGRVHPRNHPVREPDRLQERRRDPVGGFRHLRHRRRHPRRGRA